MPKSKGKRRFVRVSWPSYLAMLDAVIASTQAIINNVQQFTLELNLELAIDQWQREGNVVRN